MARRLRMEAEVGFVLVGKSNCFSCFFVYIVVCGLMSFWGCGGVTVGSFLLLFVSISSLEMGVISVSDVIGLVWCGVASVVLPRICLRVG